jgi:glycosyltransferase involved in cell wall biosynthesis
MALTIWLLNPYHTGSHKAWAEGYARHSHHRVRVLRMAGQFWKWRMHGAAIELAEQARALLSDGGRPDLILATGMVNLPAFLALMRREIGPVPAVLYMHENQLTYPPPPGSKRDLAFGMIQHLSMLAADRVLFNSAYHLNAWFEELPRLLKHFPDYTHLETVAATRAKSGVLEVGCALGRLDAYGVAGERGSGDWGLGAGRPVDRGAGNGRPLILWNQRWEYDKDPGAMLGALYALADEGWAFRAALAGENLRVQPGEFEEARDQLGARLVHYGYAETEAEYAWLLWSADIVLSTAIHEFFGVSVVEAIYCGCLPVLPARLSYPELLPAEAHARCLYAGSEALLAKLRAALADPVAPPELRAHVARFDWSVMGPRYDAVMGDVMREDVKRD